MNIPFDRNNLFKCDKCGNVTFNQSLMLHKVSRLLTGKAQDGVQPITVFSCTKCGHVNDEFLPLDMKEDNTDLVF